jgi:hypothetical protein
MSDRRILAAIVAVTAATQLSGCAYQPVSAYGDQLVPCPPTAAVSTPEPSGATAPKESSPTDPPSAPPANALNAPVASEAAGTSQPTAPNCVAAIGGYYPYAGYDPYWNNGWPYSVVGFDGFFGGRFHHGFHDHDFHDQFHHGFHDRGFHDRGFHGGGVHGGGFHGGGHGGRR